MVSLKTRGKALILGALVATAIAGCGSSGGTGSASSSASTAGGSGAKGLTHIKVAVLPATDTAPLYLGISRGFFRQEGLAVTTTTLASGSSMVPAILNGQEQFGFSNTFSTITAASKHLPVQIVAPGSTANGKTAVSANALLVSKKSGITSDPKSLEGKTIAVTSIGDSGMTCTEEWMKRAGADPSKVHFVEFSFPEMVSAIQRGTVDGAVLVEPFQTIGLGSSLVKAADPSGAVLAPGGPLAVYFGDKQYIASHPTQVQEFQKAMAESMDYAQSHPAAARAAIAPVLKLPAPVAQKMRLPLWDPNLTDADVQKVASIALDQKLISQPVSASTLLVKSGE